MSSMSKELEALYRLATRNSGNHRSIEEVDKDFKIIEKALKDYEAIKNAEPTKALECLEIICVCARVTGLYKKEDEDVVKQALIKYQEQDFNYKNIVIPFFDELADLLGTNDIDEMLDKIKEQEKALEIISKKNVDMLLIKKYDNVSDYNSAVWLSGREKLTEEQFKLLKEGLKL